MTDFYTLAGFVAKLGAIEHDMNELGPALVRRACQMVCDAAKDSLGSDDWGWVPLQPETIARKLNGNTPLLETGELRDSIEWTAHGLHGEVGSNLDRAVWMEFGTSRGVPPRPFLAGAAARREDDIHKLVGRSVQAVLAGKGLHGSEMAELIHLLRHVAHEVKEATKEFFEEEKDEDRR